MTDTLGLFCCYTQAVLFKLYHHGSVGTTELILYREIKCMSCPLSDMFYYINYKLCTLFDGHNVRMFMYNCTDQHYH